MYIFCHLPSLYRSLVMASLRSFILLNHSHQPHHVSDTAQGAGYFVAKKWTWCLLSLRLIIVSQITPHPPLGGSSNTALPCTCSKTPIGPFPQNTCIQTSSGSPQTTLHPAPTSNETSYSLTDPWLPQHTVLAYLFALCDTALRPEQNQA